MTTRDGRYYGGKVMQLTYLLTYIALELKGQLTLVPSTTVVLTMIQNTLLIEKYKFSCIKLPKIQGYIFPLLILSH